MFTVFAQEPLFQSLYDTEPGPNYALLYEAVHRLEISAVGSAPYVEATIEQQKLNIYLILKLAKMCHLHADFHLDYTLDVKTQPMIYQVIQQMKADVTRYWTTTTSKGPRVTIGHAPRLQLLSQIQWRDLVKAMDGLSISIVGLPQSDMYMMGRADDAKPLGAPRSTLRIPQLARNYGLQIAMSVNNIENAFTPQGSLDPLSLCTFGAAVFQAATPEDLRILVVSTAPHISISKTPSYISLFLLHAAVRHNNLQARHRRRREALKSIPSPRRSCRFCHPIWDQKPTFSRPESELRPDHHSSR